MPKLAPEEILRKYDRRGRMRTIRFSIAGLSLLAAFIMSISMSKGVLQFSWNSKSLLAQPSLQEGAYDLSSIVILNRVLLQLQENYVDSGRFDPRWMLAAGLNEIQEDVPEIVAEFDKSLSDGPTEVELRVGGKSQRFRFGDIESLWEMSLKYKEIFSFIQEHTSEEVSRRDIEYAAINGLLRTLDPHSVLLSPETYKNMLEGNRGNFGGLGIVIRVEEGVLKVVKPMGADTPAGKAGILKNDHIVQIGEQATLNMGVSDAVELLRGEPGTDVSIWILRPEDHEFGDTPREFVLTRDEIKIPSVKSANLGNKIAYVSLQGFQSNTYKDMVKQLEQLEEETGGIAGLVLDMRGNPGGLLDQAIKISDEFLETGNIVTTVGSGRRYKKPYDAKAEGTQPGYPIIVLVNPGSASASEIVAGALKNHDRALIVGNTTFGKGSVQVLYELQDSSALKLTIAQYLTPGEISIQSVGIVPDIKLVAMDGRDLQKTDLFLKRWVRREATLKSHLDHQSARGDQHFEHLLKYLAKPPREIPEDNAAAEDDEPHPSKDPEVRVARELLLAAGNTADREDMLKKLASNINQLRRIEDEALTTQLAGLGVDWSAGDAGDTSKLSLQLTTNVPGNVAPSGSRIEITATVTNTGSAPVHRVYGLTDSTNNDFEDLEFIFGAIPPGGAVTRTLVLKVPEHELTRFDLVGLKLFEDTDKDNASQDAIITESLGVGVRGKVRPHFTFNYTLDDTQKGNGDGLLNPGEEVTFRVFVQNDGVGPAPRPIAFLKNLNGSDVYLEYAREAFDELAPGARRHFDFRFRVQEIESNTARFEIHVYDDELGQALSQEVTVPVRLQPHPPTARQGSATLSEDNQLRSSPHPDAGVFSELKAGEKLTVHAELEGYIQVSRGEMMGWLPIEALTLETAAVSTPGAPLSIKAFGSAPRLHLDSDITESSADTFEIKGSVEDDGTIQDLYVFVINEKEHVFDSRKVAYQSIDKATFDLAINVPILPGMNRIKVVARDDLDQETSSSLYIFKR